MYVLFNDEVDTAKTIFLYMNEPVGVRLKWVYLWTLGLEPIIGMGSNPNVHTLILPNVYCFYWPCVFFSRMIYASDIWGGEAVE